MKKILFATGVVVLLAACSSNSTNTREEVRVLPDGTTVTYQNSANAKNAKFQIIDQEFDNLLAPDTDYDNLNEYELQACGATYLPKQAELKTVQPKTQVVVVKENELNTDTSRKKKVTNTTNIYYMDGPAPKKVSSTSTTTITSSSSSSSSSSANGATTYNSNASTSTSTF